MVTIFANDSIHVLLAQRSGTSGTNADDDRADDRGGGDLKGGAANKSSRASAIAISAQMMTTPARKGCRPEGRRSGDSQVRLEAQVSRVVDNFWNETQRLAAESTFLQSNQVEQAKEYRAALVAIQHHAHSSTAALAAHQQWIEVEIQKALEDTRKSPQQDLLVVVNAQAVGSEATHKFVQQELQQLREGARQESLEFKQIMAEQATKTQQIKKQMSSVLSSARDELTQKIDALIVEPAVSNAVVLSQLDGMKEQMQLQIDLKFKEIAVSVVELCLASIGQRGSIAGKPTMRRVQKLISSSAVSQESRMEDKVKLPVQQAHVELSKEVKTTYNCRSTRQASNLVKDQKDGLRAIEAKVTCTNAVLTAEIEQLMCRLAALETKAPTSDLLRPAAGLTYHSNERDHHDHSDRLKKYLLAEVSRSLYASPIAKAPDVPAVLAGTKKTQKAAKTSRPPPRSTKAMSRLR
ncbi:hypothetical protein ON010_g5957 [Phytophthora cinnamomi]|nr:hypothetical protein ON010_g5957 [Phytophthora cinnamomi]